ncbi:S1C family serine protease [Ideonella sp. A 288]|uniref:S1C family serine protease n=1 Tax=Ideonella sp. A 288 TaxID=1962181 RepID=UPI000B4BDA1B|nr:S1C family serine protease [Ideonella sp. A 288]
MPLEPRADAAASGGPGVCRRRWLVLSTAALAVTARADEPAASADSAERQKALQRAHRAVVGVESQAVDAAGSSRTLGDKRQGSGVVIGADGLVVTIGYLILEAEQVDLTTADHRRLPARVVAYDPATGFGLVQALVPLGLEPVPMGRAEGLAEQDVLMFANGGDAGGVAPTRLLSRRPFAGYWEYHLEQALFTSPPWPMHSGAGLFNPRGELVGIGSLVVADAGMVDGARRPGNMFVPIDLLPPMLDELRRSGTSAGSHRAWLGLNCVEDEGAVRVVRVTADSPADTAGLQRGDRILRIDDVEVQALDSLWKALWRGGPPARQVRLEIQRDGARQLVTLRSVDRMSTLKRPKGV